MGPVSNPSKLDTPTFNGQPIFGDNASFTVTWLGTSSPSFNPSLINSFLGLPGNTPQYSGHGQLWGISGRLIGASPLLVQASINALKGAANVTAKLGLPTGQRYPGDYINYRSAYFTPGDLVLNAAGIVGWLGYQYCQQYLLVLREA